MITALDGMTAAKWDSLTQIERDRLRDNSYLTPQLKGSEGWRVEVTDSPGDKPHRFIVGRSTGWRPCHIELANRRSSGGIMASQKYASVRTIERVR